MQKNQERSRMRKRITDNQPENLSTNTSDDSCGGGLGTRLIRASTDRSVTDGDHVRPPCVGPPGAKTVTYI